MVSGSVDRERSAGVLSRRERDVLIAQARGLTDREAAEALGIAYPTVRVYRRRAEEKLGVKGLAQCLLVAWRLGDLDLAALADEAMAERRPLPFGPVTP